MRTKSIAILSTIAISLLFFTNAGAGVIRPQNNTDKDYVPSGKGWGVPDLSNKGGQKGSKGGGHGGGGGSKSTSNGINYHGGPVMLGTTNIYYIWYGDWSSNSAVSILSNLAASLDGSPYFNINTTYYDGNNNKVSNAVAAPSASTDNYSHGKALSDSDVMSVVTNAISSSLPKDPNGVYVVLTSADVNETSGFCTQYCGWHGHASILGMDTKFAFVGNAERCPSACSAQTASGPNGNVGADAMASVIAHEVEEMVTDPDLNAWYDRRGRENADKCAWKFGSVYTTTNGSYANMNLGGLDYLIQQNWVNAGGGGCALSY